MVVAGLGFRITAVPFHFYAPDVYQGTPDRGGGALGIHPQSGGFRGSDPRARFPVGRTDWTRLGLALANRCRCSFSSWRGDHVPGQRAGLLQDNLKRLLAYSSVAHAGYMLIGLAAAPDLHGDATCRAGSMRPVLPGRLRRHDDWSLRGPRLSQHAAASGGDDRRPGRPQPQPSGRGAC